MTAQPKQWNALRRESPSGRFRISTIVRRNSDSMRMQQIPENKQRTQEIEQQKQQQREQERREQEDWKQQQEKKPNP
jgi:hypothetical protein